MARTSTSFKICYVAALLAPLCAVVAQGAVTLLTLPASVDQQLAIPYNIFTPPVDVPWSADQVLAPLNAGKIATAKLSTNWVYLEHVVGTTVSDLLPSGYIVPLRGASNDTYGMRYPTDVAQIQCNCTWVAPTLPAAMNVSYMNVSLEEFDISALQTTPNGVASMSISHTRFAHVLSQISLLAFAPLSNMTFSSNSTPVTSGLFAWTLWCVTSLGMLL